MKNSTLILKKLFCFFVLHFTFLNLFATTYNVLTSEALVAAMNSAVAGDEIILASGSYTTDRKVLSFPTADGDIFWKSFFFRGVNDGTESNPITIKSLDASEPAILVGNGPENAGYALFITGDYWKIENIKIANAAKGLVLDNSNNSVITNIEIYDIGQEAIHVRDGSSNTLIDSVNLHDIGLRNDGYGEGIYVGSDNGVWWEGDGLNTGERGLIYKRACNNTTIINSTIGPNITAEPFDIKEGTENTVVENCIIYGAGISGQNFADSHIDIKGNTAKIRCNTFYQNNNGGVARGIMIVPRITAGVEASLTANENIVHDNIFNLEGLDVEVLVANNGAGITYAWDNTRIPEDGNFYNTRITEMQPSSYTSECDGTISNPMYTVLTTILGEGTLNLSPEGGVYEEGTEVTIAAVEATGYQFENWSGDTSGTNNPITITVNSNLNITANFSQIDVEPEFYSISTSVIGSGIVTVNPEQESYEEGTQVTITATANEGYEFDDWSGDIAGSNTPMQFTVNSDLNIVANFLEIIDGGNGETCDNPTTISLSFEQDGTGTFCWVTSDNIDKINSWNLNLLTINGEDFTNKWSISMPPKIDGYYYISYQGDFPWSHFEVDGSSAKELFEDNLNGGVKFFPNPFSNEIQVDFINGEVIDISVFDQSGRLLEFYKKSQLFKGIKIGETLSSGIYFVVVQTKKGTKTFDISKY